MAVLSSYLKQFPSDQNITLLSSLFCFFIIALFLIKLRHGRRTTKSSNFINLPPSPPKLPFIGNLHQLGSLPHHSFRSLSQKYGPIMFLQLGQSPTVVLSSPEFASEVMKTHDLAFADRPQGTAPKILLYGCTDVGFAPYGEMWREKKKVCVNELLSLKRVQSFKEIREEEAGELVKKIRDEAECVNLSELLITTSNDIVCKCVFGGKFNTEGNRRMGELARKVMINIQAFCVGDYFPSLGWVDVVCGRVSKLKALFGELDEFFDQIIEEHRMGLKKKKKDDDDADRKSFVDILLHLQENGMLDYEFTQDDLKSIIMDMFIGGSDTTSTTLEWAMTELAKHPAKMKKAQEEVRRIVGSKSKVDENDISEMKYLKCIIKETLRFHPPTPLVAPRVARSTVQLSGYTIPAKTTVYINAWAIQMDPAIWEKPEEFWPERFEENDVDFKGLDFRFTPFGSGRRGCPGMIFGVYSVECMLANLLYWFDWKIPTSVQEIEMGEIFGLTVSRKVPLRLQPIPYSFGS
ncbi:cytochrome P450 71A1-like [Senna tora]|uniref:Cytochrome P450 71A1-like n=1 Tax=Senna tora TaxID=362788 RepID=A0A835CCT6_9FABA|nr:cytochrome P450 71A1-like [Senna tora]